MVGSPPPLRAAMMMARLNLLHSLPRLASMAPFLCLIVAQWECPDMASPLLSPSGLRAACGVASSSATPQAAITAPSVFLECPCSGPRSRRDGPRQTTSAPCATTRPPCHSPSGGSTCRRDDPRPPGPALHPEDAPPSPVVHGLPSVY